MNTEDVKTLSLLFLGLIGLLPLIYPIMYVNSCPVYGYGYCHGAVPVYFSVLDGIRFAYVPFALASSTVLVTGLLGLKYRVSDAVKLLLLAGYFLTLVGFTYNINRIPEGHNKIFSVVGTAVQTADINVNYTVLGKIYVISGFSPVILVTIGVLLYLILNLILNLSVSEE